MVCPVSLKSLVDLRKVVNVQLFKVFFVVVVRTGVTASKLENRSHISGLCQDIFPMTQNDATHISIHVFRYSCACVSVILRVKYLSPKCAAF